MKRHPDETTIEDAGHVFACSVCLARMRVALPMELERYGEMAKQWSILHRLCAPLPEGEKP